MIDWNQHLLTIRTQTSRVTTADKIHTIETITTTMISRVVTILSLMLEETTVVQQLCQVMLGVDNPRCFSPYFDDIRRKPVESDSLHSLTTEIQ